MRRERGGGVNYHAYSYEGPGEAIKSFDSARWAGGVGFETAIVPPERTDDWLQRPPRAVRATWDDPAEAVAWLTKQWQEKVEGHHIHPDLMTGAPTVKAMAAYTLEQLTMGNDDVWSAWLRGTMYAHFAVICCPNRTAGGPCPLGRVDTRPKGATRYVG